MFVKILNKIRNRDGIVDASTNNLHFEMDIKQKTLIGGIVTTIIHLYVLSVAIRKSFQMVKFWDPQVSSIEEGYNPTDRT